MNYKLASSSYGFNSGMTLRDYFATQAMQAIISKLPVSTIEDSNFPTAVSVGAYEYADAMLEARK